MRNLVLLAPLAVTLADASAGEVIVAAPDGSVTISSGVGLMWIRADEYVFNGPGDNTNLSLLQWETSAAPVFEAEIDLSLPHNLLIKGSIEIATGGDGYMTDYDWIAPFNSGLGPDDWSDRSQHEATSLDHLWGGDVTLGYRFFEREDDRIDLVGGVKYRDVQWSAYGGNFVYSSGAPRDTIFTEPDSELGITFRQQIPTALIGLDAQVIRGRWVVATSVRGGFAFDASGHDDHWQRPLFFVDDYHTAPAVAVSADVAYAANERIRLHVGAAFDAMFKTRADATTYDPGTGETYHDPDFTGGAQQALKLTAGISGSF